MGPKIPVAVFALSGMLVLGGCATIMNSPNQRVPVTSNPSGAEVYVDGELKGQTPMTLRLARGRDHNVVLQWGGQQRDFVLTSQTGGETAWTVGNVLVGGIVGLGVDALSGSMYQLHPREIQADFLGR